MLCGRDYLSSTAPWCQFVNVYQAVEAAITKVGGDVGARSRTICAVKVLLAFLQRELVAQLVVGRGCELPKPSRAVEVFLAGSLGTFANTF